MREVPLSIPEKKFIIKAANETKRLDGRKLEDFRKTQIHFGKDWGSCFVTLGGTKVFACVSCEVQEPRPSRPNEGLLYINVEVSTMAAPHLELSTRSDLSVHLNRMLEKCIKESKAVDLESLCLVADEKAWALRVDVNIINHEGNLLDCSALAALAAIAHFKRPDVTTDGLELTIHSLADRDPIPIALHHYPVCVSFGYISEGDKTLSDPTSLEERVSDAALVFGINAYRELCALHLGGTAVLAPKAILRCANRAALRAKELVECLKNGLKQDEEDRRENRPVGFASCCELNKITSLSQETVKIQLGKFRLNKPLAMSMDVDGGCVGKYEADAHFADEDAEPMEEAEEDCQIINLGDNTAELDVVTPPGNKKKRIGTGEFEKPVETAKYGDGGPSQWITADDSKAENAVADEEIMVVQPPVKVVENIELSGDSDEETVHVLCSNELEKAGPVKETKEQEQARQTVAITPDKFQNKKKKKGKKNRA